MSSGIRRSIQTQPGNLTEQVAESLADRIIEGEWSSDDYLPSEDELRGQYSVSRGVVREAVKMLVGRGLVRMQRGRGVMVCDLPSEEVVSRVFGVLLRRRSVSLLHFWHLRFLLEPEVASLAAENRDERDLHSMHGNLLALKNPDATIEDLINADLAFHQDLALAARNPLIELIYQAVASVSSASRRATFGLEEGLKRAIEGHSRILAAVESGDARMARNMMRQHLQESKEDLEILFPDIMASDHGTLGIPLDNAGARVRER